MSHTPGPWRVQPSRLTRVQSVLLDEDDDERTIVATCYSSSFAPPLEESIANARLISCAPELLDSLRQALRHSFQYSEGCLYCGEGEIIDGETTEEHRETCWYYVAERAISKAEANA